MDKVIVILKPVIDSIEANDDYTVTLNLKTFGPFYTQFSVRLYVLNKDLVMVNIEQNDEYGDLGDWKRWLLTNDAGLVLIRFKVS